jgi:Arginine decarboxylase (spermidine biosynthesis)
MRYADRLAGLADSEGRLNEFIRLRDGKLVFADQIDLLETVRQYGSPLEISYCPQITHRVQAMQDIFARAIAQTGYQGQAHYAYATKANFAEEVVRTAIRAGAHYETSSAFDVRIAQRLWQDGILPSDRFIFCNGSKEKAYIDAIIGLRRAGFDKVVPIIDDLDEFEQLLTCPEPLLLGVRERKDEGDLEEGATYGYDRFGLLPEEMEELAKRLAGTKHKLILYHAMVGSQLEDSHFFSKEIIELVAGLCSIVALCARSGLF